MPGFLDGVESVFNGIGKALRKLSTLGVDYKDMVIKNSKAIGVTEAMFADSYQSLPPEFLYSLAGADIGQKKYISYFEKDYVGKREYLRRFALNSEIEFILDTMTNEAIVYDSNNFFCYPSLNKISDVIKKEKEEEIREYINTSFKKIYLAFNFYESKDAWMYFKKFLIDGTLAFEIIYNDKGDDIIGFKEIDSASLMPQIRNIDGKYVKIWVQYDGKAYKRELLDTQVIYISYANGNFLNRVSYLERLIRSFNLLRILENSRIIWNIMNSSFRLKMVVPIGNKSPQKARESLAELMSIYKEDLSLDTDTGELKINGKSSIQFYKNYLMPSKNGEQPEIEVLDSNGPDLSDTEALKHFYNKLISDSLVPFSRFNKDSPSIFAMDSASSIDRDEIRFGRFIDMIRQTYQEILLKPLWIQLCLKYPDLQDNGLVKASIALEYVSDNLFSELKEMDILDKRIDFINKMLELKETDKEGNEVSYFDLEFLIKKYLKVSDYDIDLNDMYKKSKQKNKKEEKSEGEGEEDDGIF